MRLHISSAALAAALLATSASPAGVVDSGPINITLPRDFTGLGIDLVTGETSRMPNNDVVDINIFSLSDEWRMANLDQNLGGGIVGNDAGDAAAVLEVGDFVGPDSLLLQGGGIRTFGNFDDIPNAYIGLYFENEAAGTMHYGWLEVTLPSVGDGVVTRYAFESTPDTGLVIPAPASLALLGVGGLVATRRRA
jgi:MYXO-CTERM domain-containing protein